MGETRPFRLLLAGLSWPPETFLANLVRGMVGAGMHVTVGTSRKPSGQDLRKFGVDWLHMPAWRGSAVRRFSWFAMGGLRALVVGRRDLRALRAHLASDPKFSRRMQSLYRLLPFPGRRWDAIYFPWNSAAITYLPIFDLGSSVIISCRGAQVNIAPHNPLRGWVRHGLRASFDRASAVHCVSEAILREAQQHGLHPSKARIIRPAVDPAIFCPGPAGRERNGVFRVITTGTLIWRKGHEYTLQALRSLLDRGVDFRFDIIGDGPERQRVLYTIHDLGLETKVRLRGRLEPSRVVTLLQEADAFVLSSLSEGISNAVLEAMSCGIPVVTSDCGGMREAVTDASEGYVVPMRDPSRLAGALHQLATSPKIRSGMGRAGREKVLAQFTLSQQISQWLDLLHSITRNGETRS